MQGLNDMSEVQLKERLKAELDASEPGRTAVLKIVNELEQREPVKDIPTEAFLAWNALHSEEQKPRKSAWKAWVGVVAAVLVLVMFVVPPALGAENIFQLIARWSESVLSYGDGIDQPDFEYKTEHEGLRKVHDAVQTIGISANVVPSWIPEEYKLKELVTQEQPGGNTIIASFSNGEDEIVYKMSLPANKLQHQKDDTEVVIYEHSGVTHYIFENDIFWSAVWINDNIECSLVVHDSSLIQTILHSIYNMEAYYE